ncbi:MAG: DUF3667 domain-containing protein [Bacteroidota bacterium]
MNSKSKNRYCPNCYYPLEQKSEFCGNCGQKFTTGKVSVYAVFREFLNNLVALDSVVLRSMPLLLFKPGQLTLEFFKGKHKKYVSPVRLFLFSSLVFFATLTFYTGGFSSLRGEFLESTKKRLERRKAHNAMVADIDSTVINLKKKIPNTSSRNEIDSAFKRFQPLSISDTMPIFNLKMTTSDGEEFKVAFEDLFSLNPDEIIEKYEMAPRNNFERAAYRKLIKIQQDGGSFIVYMFSRLSWLIFILVPIFAMVMKFLYVRRKRYYIEHLIFGLHFHAFMFFVGILMFILIPINVAVFTPILSVIICIYLFMAMRRYYQQGFWKTLFKYSILCFSFIFVVTFASVILLFIGAALF